MNKKQKLLEWVERAEILTEAQIVGSGMSRTLDELLLEGKLDIIPHPTVREGNAPAAGIILRK